MASAKESAATPTAAKPIQTFRLLGCSVSVFANSVQSDGKTFTYHKVSAQRVYRDGDEFRSTTSFSRDDLPVVSLLLQRAWEFILTTEADRPKDETE